MKFRNLKFPEYPEGTKFKNMDSSTRMKKFGEIFDQILLYAQQYQAEMSAQLMKMIYTFLMSKAKLIKKTGQDNDESGAIRGSPSPSKKKNMN